MDATSQKVPFYERNGISVGQPRMQAGADDGVCTEIEYQYTFRRANNMIAGLGISGSEFFIVDSGYRERLYTLDLGTEVALSSALELKPILGSDDDDFTYLCELAECLSNVFRGSLSTILTQRYRVSTHTHALAVHSVGIPTETTVAATGAIVLAEVVVPANAG